MKFTDQTSQKPDNNILEIVDAQYLGDFTLKVKFSDGMERIIDFKPFLLKAQHPAIKRYLNQQEFTDFKFIDGNLNWNDYDLIFPLADLYRGYIR